jgi:hypothetical protein
LREESSPPLNSPSLVFFLKPPLVSDFFPVSVMRREKGKGREREGKG